MPKSTTRHDDNTAEVQEPPTKSRKSKASGGNGNIDTSNTQLDTALHSDTPPAPKSTPARKSAASRRASNGTKPITLLEDDPAIYEEDIAYTSSKADRDSSSLDDLDRA